MNERLNTQDLIDLLVNRQELDKKEAENFIREFFSLIEEGLKRDKSVKIKGLGTFKLVDVESRESVNVNTKERIEIQGHTKISFIPDTALRDIINKPFAHFETVILNDNIDFNDTAQNVPEEVEVTPIIEEKVTEEIVIHNIQEEAKEEEKEIKDEDIKEEEATQTIKTTEDADLSALKNQNGKEYSKSNKILTLVIVLTILLCGILLFFTYYSDLFPETKKQPSTTIAPPVKTEVVTDTVPVDSTKKTIVVTEVPKEEKPAMTKPAPVTNNTQKVSTIPFSKIPVKPDSTSYEIVGTKTQHTIKEGETLIRISYKYYGTKDLFPYLIKHNRSKIKNPNNVPLGTIINIPELKKK